MMQKLRKTMGSRDGKYQLDKIVELDEGFFETVDIEKDDDEKFAPQTNQIQIRENGSCG
jgi:hypothetical protein